MTSPLVAVPPPFPYEPGSLERGGIPDEDLESVRIAVDWVRAFLTAPHEDLGRRGPVCPYIRQSFDERLLHVTSRPETSCADPGLHEAVCAARLTFADLQRMAPTGRGHLVTILVVLPRIDRSTSSELDELHRALKDEFVAEGLMIGQFHPTCQARGLWNAQFRPLQSPVPLLAIREMTSSDLPFLVGSTDHAEVYFERYAESIPAHTRRFLVEQLVPVHGPPS